MKHARDALREAAAISGIVILNSRWWNTSTFSNYFFSEILLLYSSKFYVSQYHKCTSFKFW